MALEEDAPFGDLTSQTLVPESAVAHADLVAREPGVFAGAEVFAVAMTTLDPSVTVTLQVADGDGFERGAVLARVVGPARCRPAGRAGRAQPRPAHDRHRDADRDVRGRCRRHRCSRRRHPQDHAGAAGAGTARGALRWRAQPPLLAVGRRHGQGQPPRGDRPTSRRRCVRPASTSPHTTHIEVEVDRLDQIEAVLGRARPTRSCSTTSASTTCVPASRTIDGRALVEASGGVTLDTDRRDRPHRRRRHLGRRADPQRPGARPRTRHNGLVIYLDEAATTPVQARGARGDVAVPRPEFGNPSSHHEVGESARTG